MKKDLLTLWDLSAGEIVSLIDEAVAFGKGTPHPDILKGKTLALILEKASTRTLVSFSVAVHQLGGEVVVLDREGSQLGRGETYADTARVLSSYVNGIVLRTYSQRNAEEMARAATVPVINGLSDEYHPCQLLADLLTVREEKGDLKPLLVAWVGDGNNMANSWISAAARLGFELRVATPAGREPSGDLIARAKKENPKILVGSDPDYAVDGADVVNTDTWQSMGDEDVDKSIFEKFQVNSSLLRHAAKDAIVLHCLPAHRGEEITSEVMDGNRSCIWRQAANRLPVQKAILKRYLGGL